MVVRTVFKNGQKQKIYKMWLYNVFGNVRKRYKMENFGDLRSREFSKYTSF